MRRRFSSDTRVVIAVLVIVALFGLLAAKLDMWDGSQVSGPATLDSD